MNRKQSIKFIEDVRNAIIDVAMEAKCDPNEMAAGAVSGCLAFLEFLLRADGECDPYPSMASMFQTAINHLQEKGGKK